MAETNPYQPPQAKLGTADAGVDAERVASGQKLVLYAFLVYLAGIFIQMAVGPLAGLLALVALIMALIGVIRLGSALGWSILSRIGIFILMFVPFVNLLTLLAVNARATTALRSAGYKVGLLGASKPDA